MMDQLSALDRIVARTAFYDEVRAESFSNFSVLADLIRQEITGPSSGLTGTPRRRVLYSMTAFMRALSQIFDQLDETKCGHLLDRLVTIGDMAQNEGIIYPTPLRAISLPTVPDMLLLCGSTSTIALSAQARSGVLAVGIGRLISQSAFHCLGLERFESVTSWLGASSPTNLDDWAERLEDEIDDLAQRLNLEADGVEVLRLRGNRDCAWQPVQSRGQSVGALLMSERSTSLLRVKVGVRIQATYAVRHGLQKMSSLAKLSDDDAARFALWLQRINGRPRRVRWLEASDEDPIVHPLRISWREVPRNERKIQSLGIPCVVGREQKGTAFDFRVKPFVNNVLQSVGFELIDNEPRRNAPPGTE